MNSIIMGALFGSTQTPINLANNDGELESFCRLCLSKCYDNKSFYSLHNDSNKYNKDVQWRVWVHDNSKIISLKYQGNIGSLSKDYVARLLGDSVVKDFEEKEQEITETEIYMVTKCIILLSIIGISKQQMIPKLISLGFTICDK